MKTMYLFFFSLITLLTNDVQQNSVDLDLKVLIGTWQLDMSPQDKTDSNFAMMRISKLADNSFEGEFYREGVKIRNAHVNTQTGVIYGALVSGDNSGDYHSTFYLEDGILHGTTHALSRNFLSVWTASKID